MNIKHTKDNDKLVVAIEGSIDTNTAPTLFGFFERELKDVSDLTLDFAKVDYVSSAGLRAILFAQKTMAVQGKMVVKHVNEDVMEVFKLTCFTDILTFVE